MIPINMHEKGGKYTVGTLFRKGRKVRNELGMKKRVADLERKVKIQQLIIEILFEFSRSVANANGKDLLSYQQLNSPSPYSSKKVRMLFDKVRKFGKGTFDKDRKAGNPESPQCRHFNYRDRSVT